MLTLRVAPRAGARDVLKTVSSWLTDPSDPSDASQVLSVA